MEKDKKIMLVITGIVLVGMLFMIYWRFSKNKTSDVALACQSFSEASIWYDEYQECEGVSEDWCDEQGGEYNPCDSDCRHEEGELIPCTLQCIFTCSFDNDGEQNIIVTPGENPYDSTYIIEGEAITLEDGKAEIEIAPGSASKSTTSIFEANTEADINGNGMDDNIVVLTQDNGGSGIFYYVAVAINTEEGYMGTNAIYVGDRIAPQTTAYREDTVIFNYADRMPWEDFSASSSVGKSKYMFYEDDFLAEIERPVLTQEMAEEMAVEKEGDCTQTNECDSFEVTILDGVDGVWYIQTIEDGLKDGSVKAIKKIYGAYYNYVTEVWSIGEDPLVSEYKCQQGRGQQEFGADLCL